MVQAPDNNCEGDCSSCSSPDSCPDNICTQHTGNTSKISALMERVGSLEDRDSVVDNLTGRVNLLINISIIVIVSILGNFTYSFTVNRQFEHVYSEDKLLLKDTLHNLETRIGQKIDSVSEKMREEIYTLTDTMEDRFDEVEQSSDERFDQLEKKYPLIELEIQRLKDRARQRDIDIKTHSSK